MNTKLSSARKYLEKLRGGPMTFAGILDAIIVCDEVSPISLAEKMGISRAQICDIRKGRRTVSPERAAEFAKILGYPPQVFVQVSLEDQLRKVGLKYKVELKAA